ncbi:MAG: phosphopentomutase [Legionellaceae bacterium]|nr:phosphopentomutase [Legionellaceae bacterium]HAF87316.1 phosphopentomutase [Legionellales bacterium]HCA89691.1 phosphopentomutase [Legionellales bacterium]|tara:strand:- start:4307 stop:5503 length:1197 start_codon:yes stop_codon:yes gene_type:complete
MTKRRVCILLLDSLGIGASLDAAAYGDTGADTFGHIVDYCRIHQPTWSLPNLSKLGLFHAHAASTGRVLHDLSSTPAGYFGYAVEQSVGKDTPSGHWELAGVPVTKPWGYFPNTIPCFPEELLHQWFSATKLTGALGLRHASGTHIINELGDKHIQTKQPIVYTSADSVFQIAAHETYFGLERLYEISEVARRLVDDYGIGRVIARPFVGESGAFVRTGNRRDYATPPPAATLLDKLHLAQKSVVAIGKIADIYAHQGITHTIKAHGNEALFDATLTALTQAPDASLIFTNFVDFDSLYGHRRDTLGYAKALAAFDARLPELWRHLRPDDLVVISADHGCDTTFPGSDHTREHVPVLGFGPNIKSCFIGRRETFADIGQSIAEYLNIAALESGVSFLR